jgi:hypothetical protein
LIDSSGLGISGSAPIILALSGTVYSLDKERRYLIRIWNAYGYFFFIPHNDVGYIMNTFRVAKNEDIK